MSDKIFVLDIKKFVNGIKEIKHKLRYTYVDSSAGESATIIRYLDYASLLHVINSSTVSVKIADIELEDVPATLEHTFEIEKVEIGDEDEEIVGTMIKKQPDNKLKGLFSMVMVSMSQVLIQEVDLLTTAVPEVLVAQVDQVNLVKSIYI